MHEQLGVRFIRGMPGDIYAQDGTIIVQVENSETKDVLKIHADLVVLSVGIRPTGNASTLAERLGITCDESGFFESVNVKSGPVQT